MMFQRTRLTGMFAQQVRGLSSRSRSALTAGGLVMAGAVLIGQAGPAGGGGGSCWHMSHSGPCGGPGETSDDFLECPQESCIAWEIITGDVYECVACKGPDGWICTNNGQVQRIKYEAYCTVPLGICAYTPTVQQTCISAVAISACNCPP